MKLQKRKKNQISKNYPYMEYSEKIMLDKFKHYFFHLTFIFLFLYLSSPTLLYRNHKKKTNNWSKNKTILIVNFGNNSVLASIEI